MTLLLFGTNALAAAANYAGVSVAANKTLVIDGDGSLAATGGSQATGIGGSLREAGGTIVISNGTVTAAGGYRAAGIGGGFNGSAGACTIAGGTVTATGGEGGAGIGGGYAVFGSGGGHGGTTTISGGRVFATGGNQAAGIGGGRGGSNSKVYVSGGTVVPRHGAEVKYDVGSGYDTSSLPWEVKFTGGSVSTFSTNVTERPVNAGGTRVWRVEIGGLTPGGKVTGFASIAGAPDLSGYGINDIWVDDDGKVYLWLPNGNHNFTLAVDGGDAVEYVARVADADTIAYVFVPAGLTVNGRDVAYLGGDGWWSDATNSVYLTASGPFTVSGTSTVYGVTARANCSVTVSNLYLRAKERAAFEVGGNGVTVELWSEGEGTNTLISAYGYAGIAVCDANNASLRIKGGAAPLSATSWRCGAGIGGNDGAAAGTISIEGGTVLATGSQGGAGIGGGSGGGAGSITISGGTVEFASWRDLDQGFEFGAGIGGGRSGSGGTVTITGGTLTGTAGTGGAGIGGGYEGKDVFVHIEGGTITIPRSAKDYTTGIGMGQYGRDVTVEILGGTISAKGSWLGSGIGGGAGCQGGSVVIMGGRITAEGGGRGPGIGPAADGTMGVIMIMGGTVEATAGTSPADVGAGSDASGGVGGKADVVTFQGGNILAGPAKVIPAPKNLSFQPVWAVDTQLETWNADEQVEFYNLPGSYVTKDVYPTTNGLVRLWLPDGDWAFTANGSPYRVNVAGAATTAEVWRAGFSVNGRDVAYFSGEGWLLDWESKRVSLTNEMDYVLSGVSSNFWVLADANCRVPLQDVTIDLSSPNVPDKRSAFAVSSNCTAAVELFGTNYLKGAKNGAGVNVLPTAVVSIDGEGMIEAVGGLYAPGIGCPSDVHGHVSILGGTVVARGGTNSAGIGGGDGVSGGFVSIKGGTVTATGAYNGAGIGGGQDGSGGTVHIEGGKVEAKGGTDAAGIGSSYRGSGGTVIIQNAVVTATGGASGAGIGGGDEGKGAEVAIYSGTVTAVGGSRAAGIGGGNQGGVGGGTIIYDGTVTATGGVLAAGIGGGYRGVGNGVEIHGGTVSANGGVGGAGIGGGEGGGSGDIAIWGGTVTATGGYEGAGIGGGSAGSTGEIRIYSGTVVANGGGSAAGIGGGKRGGSNIGISGGTVEANGGQYGAGIGGGFEGVGGTISISRTADVKATGGEDGAGIGSGKDGLNGGAERTDLTAAQSRSRAALSWQRPARSPAPPRASAAAPTAPAMIS